MNHLNISRKRKQPDECFTFNNISQLKGLYRSCLVNDAKQIAKKLENLSSGLFDEIRIKYQSLGAAKSSLDENFLETQAHDPVRLLCTIQSISFKVFKQLDLLSKQMVLNKYQIESEEPWPKIHLQCFQPLDLSLLFSCMIYVNEYSEMLRNVQEWRCEYSDAPPKLLDLAIKNIARFLCDRTRVTLNLPGISDPKFPDSLAFLRGSRAQNTCIRSAAVDLAEVKGTTFLWETVQIEELKAEASRHGINWVDVINYKASFPILRDPRIGQSDIDLRTESLKDRLDGILDTVDRIKEFVDDKEQTSLVLDKLYLDTFPDIWGYEPFVSRLIRLDLADNNLDELSDDMAKLKNLKTINLCENSFLSVPICLTKIHSLEEINLEWNSGIIELTEELFNLGSLKILNLGSTCISTIPPEIVRLQQLETLTLRETDVTELPDYLADLPALTAVLIKKTPTSNKSVITNISFKLLDMRADCTLDFSGAFVPKTFHDEWQRRKDSGDYRGPEVIFN